MITDKEPTKVAVEFYTTAGQHTTNEVRSKKFNTVLLFILYYAP